MATKTKSFRIREDLLERLRQRAQDERRPLQTQAEIALEEWLAQQEAKK